MSSEPTKIHLLPEAQATSWDALMPPVKTAVSALLFRIQAAHQSIIPDKNESTSNTRQQAGSCFLVYGSRGTGKTSVLLNAQRAVNRKLGSEFFNKTEEEPSKNTQEIARKKAQEEVRKATKDQAEKLHKDIVWLDILNLEPLPSEANLLTVLLTKIRSALNSQSDSRHSERRSVFEEEAGSARQLLTNLINDATYMWDNVKEADTRNLSQRQVKAAEIYTGFQEKFKKAMDKLVTELLETPSSDNKLSIILPIDNIDRSTDHLQSIVKLAQLVAHPNLWLVMAGDRVEVETFLERAYWKELIKSSDGADARGKTDSEGEDETLAMARRQANATAQKLWPTNHRVEVNLVSPKETLEFKYTHHSDNQAIKDIKALLECLQIPTIRDQRKNKFEVLLDDKNRIALIDLFDVTDKVKDDAKQNNDEGSNLTRAAQHGLLLPARNVLDLWQLLHCLVEDKETSDYHLDFKAEKVARTMLRIAIASSSMISEIAQDLQTDILRRGRKRGDYTVFCY